MLILALLIFLFAILVFNAVRIKSKGINIKEESNNVQVSSEDIAQKLSKIIQVETISDTNQGVEEKFSHMRAVLEELFPEIFSRCEKEIIAGNGLLLHWPGKNKDKNPYLFMAHMDVVPVEGTWTHPPFGGVIDNGKLFGRGASDMKGTLSVMLSGLNHLAKKNFTPDRDIYFLSTASEEISGPDAADAVDYFKKKGITLDLVLDEGGAVLRGLFPGFDDEIALIGITEKSIANVMFTAESNGGHASMPPIKTPLGQLGEFIASVEKKPPFQYKFTSELKETFKSLAPYAGFKFRLVFANLWFFSPFLTLAMKKVPTTRALLGTTCAFTMASGSDAHNVLPSKATVVANLRISHHEGVKNSFAALEERAKQFGVKMEVIKIMSDIDKVSSTTSSGYSSLSKAINQVYPNARIAPYLMVAATDSRYFHEISNAVLRFAPFRITDEERASIHSIDEFINIEGLGKGAEVIIKLVEEA